MTSIADRQRLTSDKPFPPLLTDAAVSTAEPLPRLTCDILRHMCLLRVQDINNVPIHPGPFSRPLRQPPCLPGPHVILNPFGSPPNLECAVEYLLTRRTSPQFLLLVVRNRYNSLRRPVVGQTHVQHEMWKWMRARPTPVSVGCGEQCSVIAYVPREGLV